MTDIAIFEQALPVISSHIYQSYTSKEISLTSEELERIISQFSPIFSLSEANRQRLLGVLETQHVTTMGVGVSLIDDVALHDEEWHLKQDIEWKYWNDYKSLLIQQGWSTRVVHSMDSVTDRILGLLKNPLESGDWERKGLVIGHVQSGKTANYIGLITKAADAGYKFIIVIAGILDNLRTQTQERVDEGFIGRDSETKRQIGVGSIRPNRDTPVTVTTKEGDFNKSVANRFGLELKHLNNTFILVIKKNASTLTYLYNWLKELNTRSGLEKIVDIPMLLIDDEADNASINTNNADLTPTAINRGIRNILSLFRKRCYVGYTATPFANIFINPDTRDEKLGGDLFPDHFIHCLDAPTNYFGSEKLFLDDEKSKYFVRDIEDAESQLPLKHKKDHPIDGLPESLEKAIRVFILTRAVRNLRGQELKHHSMMINVSRFVNIQRDIRALVGSYLKTLDNAISFNYNMPVISALKNRDLQKIHNTFAEEFHSCEYQWDEIMHELKRAVTSVKVIVVNSKSDDNLDYASYTKTGQALTVIAIGGLSLSRGLTLEGLTVSYMYRNSKMYDTLMQMGRWFGYRDKYEDLCRVYLSKQSQGWYSHIANATEELRMQIKQMRRAGKTPRDFGLYVRAHPDTLIVTALNKMRYTEGMELNVTYNGIQKDTYLVPSDTSKTQKNRDLIINFFNNLLAIRRPTRESNKIGSGHGSYLFCDVGWNIVEDFVYRFHYHEYWLELHQGLREYIATIADLCPQWDVIFQSLSTKQPREPFMISTQVRSIGTDEAGTPTRPPAGTEPGWYLGNKNRFSSNSNFKIGLSETQLRAAQDSARDNSRSTPIHKDYTSARGKPVLVVNLLTLQHENIATNITETVLEDVPALSFSFLDFPESRTVKYVVGRVWLLQNQLDLSSFDGDDDEL